MRTFVTAVEQKWIMQALAESGHRFKNFPAARYATDVTFQQRNVEVSVVPNGFAIDCTKFYKGSVSDKTIFDENIDSHLANLAKRTGETTLEALEPGMEQWAVLADKCYQGIQHNVWAVLPLKKPVGGILTFAEQAKNDRIASDRVIVENYFGRLKTFWATCSKYVPYVRWEGGDKHSGATKASLATEIVGKLGAHGIFHRTTKDVVQKIGDVERSYRSACDWLSNTGQGIVDEDSIQKEVHRICPYYYTLDEVMRDRASTAPLVTSDDLDLGGSDNEAEPSLPPRASEHEKKR
ncbi:hypothetical protein DYB31_002651 [Aphanomyces astaci]|uniref:DDE Tnp4 domain-containing protein n=1 Tax=Aphanomyces astaci TaxID=112090 RepID=A0A397ET17_APHAT|nr:hypothetical protein DYB31_002651 [Aphanomyces astaci]